MSKAPDTFKLNTYELPRRAGEMKEYELDIVMSEKFGVELISVPAGEVIEVDVRLESVTEGVLLSADVYAVAQGECIRCLDPLEIVIERKIQELYNYEPTNERGKKKKSSSEDLTAEDLDVADELMMDGNILDLETPIRDAVVLSLPTNPLCSQDLAFLRDTYPLQPSGCSRIEKRFEQCQYQSEKCRVQRRAHDVASGKLLQPHYLLADSASSLSCSTQHAQRAVLTTVARY
jgi:uncharacterized protein